MAQQNQDSAAAKDLDAETYSSLRNYEEHFNGVQVEVKKLASAWMLATFAAIAFIVRGDLSTQQSLLDSGSLLVLIGLGSNIGLLSLWILDQRVNQNLLSAAFDVGLTLERTNPNLPPIRSMMWLNSGSRGMGRYHALFYVCPMILNVAASIYGLGASPAAYWPWLLICTAVAIGALLAPLSQSIMASSERQSSDEIRKIVDDWKKARAAGAPRTG
ncbi:MAG TPA: hypothetical protein VMN38_08875 [Sphingomicrobium sp.]|nr:hypothetical protein [Sphingomicrobium sp.]